MESFRRLIKGWLGKVLLVLFLVPLALAGMEGLFGSGPNKEGVAKTVNDLEITDKDLEAQIKNYKDQYLAMVQGDESLLNQSYIAENALDSLVHRVLLIQQAEQLGITLSDDQIEKMIAQQPSLQVDGVFSQKAYENYLRSVGMTSQSLIQNLRQDHSLKILTSMIADNALVSKLDIQQISSLQNEQRAIMLSAVKLDEYKKQVKVTDAEVSDYYNKNQNKFKQVASVDLDYVVVSASDVAGTATTVSDAELQQAYEQFATKAKNDAPMQVRHILIAADADKTAEAEKLANDVYAKIQAGLSFDKAAAEYSTDTSSKDAGGLIEGYAVGTFGQAFDDAVKSSVNTTSKPVKTEYGYHIIRAQQEQVQVPSFEAEKARLSTELLQARNANLYTDTVNRLNESVVDNDALDVVTQEVKTARVQTAKGVTIATADPILSQSGIKVKLFSEEVKNGDRNASSSIQLNNGDTVWFKVREYHAAGVSPLAQVKTKAKEQLIEQKAYDLAKAKIADMLADFKKLPAQEVLAKYKQSFENAGVFVRSQGLKREIERAAFSVAAPKKDMWSVTTTLLPNEMVVVAVANVTTPTLDSLTDEKSLELQKLYQTYRGNQMLNDYTSYLKANAKIK